MKLVNSTDFDNRFLRRMVTWCCRQVGYKVGRVRSVQFRNRTKRAYSGRAHGDRCIVVSVGPAELFPTAPDSRPGIVGMILADRLEALVTVTAHELAHLCQYRDGRSGRLSSDRKTEHDARWNELRTLNAFRRSEE